MSRRDWCVVTPCASKITKKRRRAQERADQRERDAAAKRFRPTVAQIETAAELRRKVFKAPPIPAGFRRVYTRDGDHLEPIPGWTP